jgi:hypothetical protein
LNTPNKEVIGVCESFEWEPFGESVDVFSLPYDSCTVEDWHCSRVWQHEHEGELDQGAADSDIPQSLQA